MLIQNMDKMMALLDFWSIPHLIIIGTQILAVKLILKNDKINRSIA